LSLLASASGATSTYYDDFGTLACMGGDWSGCEGVRGVRPGACKMAVGLHVAIS